MSRNNLPTFDGVPLHEQPTGEIDEHRPPDWDLFVGWVVVFVLMLANAMIYAKQQGWW